MVGPVFLHGDFGLEYASLAPNILKRKCVQMAAS